MLVTEKPGRLRIIRDGRLVAAPVEGVPEVYARGQGGLLEVTAHPDFASNRMVYLSYSKPQGGDASTTVIARARFENDALHNFEELFVANSEGRGHYGSRIVFDGEGHGFRSEDAQRRSYEAELSFWGQVFGFEPADDVPPLQLVRGQ